MELIHSGSVKNVYSTNQGELEFEFTDRISVFDKPIPSLIPFKGEALCKTAVFWFQKAKEMGIRTHFIAQAAPNRIRVKKVDILRDYSAITLQSAGYLVPCEFILRHYAAGGLYDRLKSGAIDPKEAGLARDKPIPYGTKLPSPLFEFTTKLERIDSPLTPERVLEISGITEEILKEIRRICFSLDEKIQAEIEKRGLIHADGKKEFAMDEGRNLMIVDVFGTADEDRFWDGEEYRKGNCVELSKEFVRRYYRGIGYKDNLYRARSEGREEPDIPPLPQEIIDTASSIYIDIFERITGQTFSKG